MKLKTKTILLLIPLALSMTACGGNKTPEHVHSKETAYSYDENGHYHVCSCDENIRFDYTEHTYTTNNEGINSCSICGYVENQAKDKAWKTIKNSIENTINYNGVYTLVVSDDMNTLETQIEDGKKVTSEAKVKNNGVIATDPNSGKYLSSSKSKKYEPTQSSWIDTQNLLRKIEIEDDKYVYYYFNGEEVSSEYTDKYYGQSLGGANPLDAIFEGSLYVGENSFLKVLSRMESYNELIKYFPEIFLLNSKLGNANITLEMKDNLYVLNFNFKQIKTAESRGLLAVHDDINYCFYFNEEKCTKAEFILNSYSEALNGSTETMNYKTNYDFKYQFDEELYSQGTFENKPTPSSYSSGKANLIFNDGYVWKNAYSSGNEKNKITDKVTDRATDLGLELYYDKDFKNKVSDDELLTTLPKSYYVKQSINPDKAYVLLFDETNYKASSLYKKYLKEYTVKNVSSFQIYSSDNVFNIFTFPNNSEMQYLNAKVTVNGEEVTNSNVSVSVGNVYTIIVSKDALITPFA